uniref:Uncharacterized protein n=1 Tax=Arundo donax TaxID=35708 RepID=A0A0A8YE90_ARUDO
MQSKRFFLYYKYQLKHWGRNIWVYQLQLGLL